MKSDRRMHLTEIGGSLSVGVTPAPNGKHVRLIGDLDMSSADALERELMTIEDHPGSEHMVVDLTDLRYVDSSGLDALLNVSRRARDRRLELELTRGHAGLQRVFELTGLDRVLPFRDDGEQFSSAPA